MFTRGLLLSLVVAIFITPPLANAQPESFQNSDPIVPSLSAGNAPSYVEDEIIVEFTETAGKVVNAKIRGSLKKIHTTTGLAEVDAKGGKYKVHKISPLFKSAKPRKLKDGKEDRRKGFYKIKFKGKQNIEEVLSTYRALPDIQHAQPNYIYTPDEVQKVVPYDTWYSTQYAHQLTEIESAWGITTGSDSIVVAVIGTGVQMDHTDLEANIWSNSDELPGDSNGDGFPGIQGVDDDGDGKIDEDSAGLQPGEQGYTNDLSNDDDENGYIDDTRGWNFESNNNDPSPGQSRGSDHETGVAGIVAAVTDNDEGIAGVSWHSRIMPLRIAYTTAQVAAAIDYASNNGAHVINMSFGRYDLEIYGPDESYGPDTAVELAVNSAYADGIVLVATAGNNGIDWLRYPAAHSNVIAVGASDINDERAYFSNYGSWVSVVAPGTNILTTIPGGLYGGQQGTSFGAPYVAGLAALILSKDQSLSPFDVRMRIEYSADKINPDLFIGTGRVNAFNALSLMENPSNFSVIKSPLDYTLQSQGMVDITGTALGDQYQLAYKASESTSWTDIVAGGPQTVDGVLGTVDVDALPECYVDLKLTSLSGASEKVDQITFYKDSDLKDGWPKNSFSSIVAPLSYDDIDGDGDMEIFAATKAGHVYARHHDGNKVEGWQQAGTKEFFGSPSIGDIDGDGDKEIVQATNYNGRIYAWHHNGTKVSGWPVDQSQRIRGAVSLADLNSDGALDVIVADKFGAVHAYDGSGNDLDGWPIYVDPDVKTTPAIGDIDNDGDMEVIIHQLNKLYAFHHDGTPVTGWPIALSGEHTSPILGDIDGDGDVEIIAASLSGLKAYQGNGSPVFDTGTLTSGGTITYGFISMGDIDDDNKPEFFVGDSAGRVYGINDDGTLLPGWPQTAEAGTAVHGAVIADIDGDGNQEILVNSNNGRTYGWNADGSPLAGCWPKRLGLELYGAPVVGDFDNDGLVDVAVGNSQGVLYTFSISGSAGSAEPEWPMYQHNAAHTGAYLSTMSCTASSASEMISPVDGSTFTSNSETFSWMDVCGAEEYMLIVSSEFGMGDIDNITGLTSTFVTVDNLPVDGIVRVDLWTIKDGESRVNSYTYNADTILKSEINMPTDGSTFTSNAVTFQWTDVGAEEYYLYVGTAPGFYDIYSGSQGTNTSGIVYDLPADGSDVYVQMLSRIDGIWRSNDYTYTAFSASASSPPMANTGGPYAGTEGIEITFDGTGSTPGIDRTIVSYAWDFGDGTPTGTGANPKHTYTTFGNYTVALTVTDDMGTSSETANTTATIEAAQDPVVSINGPDTGVVGTPVNFSANNGPDDAFYYWLFGDGTSASGYGSQYKTAEHPYNSADDYTVTLWINFDPYYKDITINP